MYWLRAGGPNLEFGWPIGISLLSTFDLSLPNWALPGPRHIALLMAKDVVEGYAVILLTTVLGTVIGSTTEATPGYTSTVFSSMVILIVPKVLYNIIAIVKQFVVIELTI